MIVVVPGHGEIIQRWVAERIPGCDGWPRGTTSALAAWDGVDVVAAVIYSEYRQHDITVSMAAASPRWALRGVIRAFLAFPFLQLRCARVTAPVARDNHRSRRLVKGLGFRLEGVMRRGHDGRADCMVYGMLSDEAERWLGELDGQEVSCAATGT